MKRIGHLKGRYLLFNFGTFVGQYYYRRDALEHLRRLLDKDFHRWREYYDLIKGDIVIYSSESDSIRFQRGSRGVIS